jgi:hypothetical protein
MNLTVYPKRMKYWLTELDRMKRQAPVWRFSCGGKAMRLMRLKEGFKPGGELVMRLRKRRFR